MTKALQAAGASMRKFVGDTTALGKLSDGAFSAVAVGAGVAAGAIVKLGVDSLKAFSESEDIMAQTAAVLKSTGGAAGVTSDQVVQLASSMESLTTFSDESVQSAENLLLTFRHISSDIFPQTTQAVLDMSTALGTDLKSSAIQLGKALDNPILGMTALRRVGVSFSQAQVEVIKNLVHTGDLLGAQQVILKEVSKEFGGSAAAAADTFSGSLKQLSNSVNNLEEDIGRGLAPIIESLAKDLKALTEGDVGPAIQAIDKWGGAFKFFGGILGQVEGSILDLVRSIETLIELLPGIGHAIDLAQLPKLNDAFVKLVNDSIDANRAVEGNVQSTRKLSGQLDAFGEATGRADTAVSDFVDTVRQDYNSALENSSSDTEAWGATTQQVLSQARDDFAQWRNDTAANLDFVSARFGSLASDFTGSSEKIARSLQNALTQQKTFGKDLQAILKDGTEGSKLLVTQLIALGPAGADAAHAIATGSDAARASIESSLEAGATAAQRLSRQMQAPLVGTLKDIRTILSQIAKSWGIDINLHGDKSARDSVHTLSDQLNKVENSSPYTAQVKQEGADEALKAAVALYTQLTLIDGSFTADVFANFIHSPPVQEQVALFQAQLDELTMQDYVVQVRVAGHTEKDLNDISSALDGIIGQIRDEQKAQQDEQHTLKSLIADITGTGGLNDAWLEEAMTFRRTAKELDANLSEAQDNLQKLTDQANEFGDAISSAFDAFDLVGGLGDLSAQLQQSQIDALQAQLDAATANQGGGEVDQALVDSLNAQIAALQDAVIVPTAEEMSAFLDQQLASAQAFAAALTQLSTMGLDPTLLQQFAAGGPEELPFMQALISGGQDVIDQFNATQAAIDAVAQDTASQLSMDAFGEALDKASRQLDKATADIDKFDKQLGDFIDALQADAVKNEMDDLVDSLKALQRQLDDMTGRGGGGNGVSSGVSGVQLAAPQAPVTVNVAGNVLSENDLVDAIHTGLLKKSSRNAGALGF